jgi:hypothetical protein
MTEENNYDDEEVDVEILEFAIGDEEIDELIAKLNELKQTKGSFEFEIDEENQLLIHHEDDEELNINVEEDDEDDDSDDNSEDDDLDEEEGNDEDEEIIFEVGGKIENDE